MTPPDAHRAITAIFRLESPMIIARLTRMVHDVGLAEELVQDALVAALEQWPNDGIPDNPGAWLTAAAKHRAVNALRRGAMAREKHQQLEHEGEAERLAERAADAIEASVDDIGDELLRLMFIACHPVLSPESRAALTLRLLGGLTTEEIARAFLVPEPTIAQRIVRAKRTLSDKRIPFEVPSSSELDERLASVLDVIYLIFNEGYSATSGDAMLRLDLCDEALRLGRVLAELEPNEPEVHGLVALMELAASRSAARVGPSGEPILLMDQDRGLWNHLLIERGLAALDRAQALGGARGPYALQAAIAACHARANAPERTDWQRIAALYAELFAIRPSPVVALNHAVAVSRAEGPEAGLAMLDRLGDEPTLSNYHLLPSARADLLQRLERFDEARREFERAASLTENTRQRERLLERAAQCRHNTAGSV